MADVVSPRGVTYNATCHQWFTGGLSSILTLPTICVHRCRVSHVSLHVSKGRAGQLSPRSLWYILFVLSIWCSARFSLYFIAAYSVALVAFFFPWISVIVVAKRLPEA